MALINCPECGKSISDKSVACPHCGLPSAYFKSLGIEETNDPPAAAQLAYKPAQDFDYSEFKNLLLSFDRDYHQLLTSDKYISAREMLEFHSIYDRYTKAVNNPLIMQYIKTNAVELKIDDLQLERFSKKMLHFDANVEIHNENFLSRKLGEYKEYFDRLLSDIDPNISLDEEQRRAVLTDDNHCLLVAGAGAGKTTTMAAKVKYLVEKQDVNPEDIIVISYTNKAIDELKDRINKKLEIPAKISTFHKFAYEIVKQSTSEPPEVNIYAYKIVFDILEKEIFNNKQLMKNLVLFLGYYFDLAEDVFKFNSLNEYHMYKASLDYETLKSGLDEYIKEVEHKRSKKLKTLTGEYLRSVQEVRIANFLFLHNIDYEYEKVYPFEIPNARKKYTPDFFIKQGENECYIEHFGISESLKSFVYSKTQLQKYVRSINDKREQHRKFKTDLLETWSYYNDKRPLLEHLKEELQKRGFILKPRDYEVVYRKIVETGKDKYIKNFVCFMLEFIEQFKTTGYDEGGFDVLRKKTDNVRTLLFLDIAQQVYNYYQGTLKAKNQLDFDNVIILNMAENKFGFPCQIEDDPIMKMVRYEDKSMPFAEERRLFYVALTRTKNRVYIAAPLKKPSRFLVELINDYNLPHPEEMNLGIIDMFSLRCPVCKFPLKYEFNKNYGLPLYICTNEPEVCDFMTNDRNVKKDIFKCTKCKDGYMIVKTNTKTSQSFYGCTNYNEGKGCDNSVSIVG